MLDVLRVSHAELQAELDMMKVALDAGDVRMAHQHFNIVRTEGLWTWDLVEAYLNNRQRTVKNRLEMVNHLHSKDTLKESAKRRAATLKKFSTPPKAKTVAAKRNVRGAFKVYDPALGKAV